MSAELLQQIRENQNKLDNCKRHKFIIEPPFKLGQKFTCHNCGGTTDGPKMYAYIQGYEAAGGNANDICEEYRG